MDSKKETNYKLQIRRPTRNPNSIKRDLQKLNSNNKKEDWYPGKERDDISSDNPYFADEKYKNEMKRVLSDSDSPVSSELVSECDEPGAITIGQRLSDVYEKEQNFNREDVYE